jgi:hypothetical protein
MVPAFERHINALHKFLTISVATRTARKRTIVCTIGLRARARLLAEDGIMQHVGMALADACVAAG